MPKAKKPKKICILQNKKKGREALDINLKNDTQLDDVIEKYENIAITGHVRPDGDCLGSCLGIKNYINNKFPSKKVTVYLEEIMDRLNFLPGVEEIDHDFNKKAGRKHDLIIVLDASSFDRLGDSEAIFEATESRFSIDHHATNTHFVDNLVLEPESSSTCELVYTMLDPKYVDYNVAMCLYTGMITDSGVFKYSSTSKRTMIVAGELMDRNIPFQTIIDGAFYSKTYEQAKVCAYAIENVKFAFDGKCAYAIVDKNAMEKCGVTPKDMDGTIDELRLIIGVECALLIYQIDENDYKISLRAKDYMEVDKIAVEFGGGGHVRAAGASFDGNLEANLNKILELIGAQIR